MKKILAVLLTLTLIVSFAACGNNNTEATVFTDQLQQEGKIIVGISPDYPPYEYYAEDGSVTGFDADAIKAIVEILNENEGTELEVELLPMDFSTIVSAVQTGQVDVGVSCFTYDPDRDVLFTDPYLKSAQVAVVKKGSEITTVDQLVGKNIGAGTGTTGEAAALEIQDAKVTSPGDYTVMFEILKNDGLDAIVCDEAVGLNYESTGEFTVIAQLVNEEVSAIVENDNTLLGDALNKAIAVFIESETYTNLKAEYGLN